eukprot:Gregarina_sp_Pseudo_9__1854@NODE_2266_length_1070_cov_50_339476_g2085_i0_p1_GENE_NODE_2266_length_1070_cov_50_339476_g2085_i0NODE_2266_length_1070_cov_50_339476_g2085_i0_p1_ORF_typecomplete_len324_score26_40YTH/PF04146_15/1_1e35_NODE_2266_length_1070_cov_50_339476_g2085_i035973
MRVENVENLWQRLKSDPHTQYYLLKSFAAEHVTLSKETGVWATGIKKERVLANAFISGHPVVLVFSVNGSGKFFGYALMASRPGDCSIRRPVFTGPDGQPFPGNQFHVQWINVREVSFKYFEHITNELNENKPVKVGRDGQQISWSAGGRLLEIFESTPPESQSTIRNGATPSNRAVIFVDRQHSNSVTPDVSQHKTSGSGEEGVSKPPPPPPPSGDDKKLISAEEESHVTFQDCLESNAALSIYPIDLTKMTYEGYQALLERSAQEDLSRYISTLVLGRVDDWTEEVMKQCGATSPEELAGQLRLLVGHDK